MRPTIFDNNNEQVVQEEFVTSENSDMFIDSNNREIDLYATQWQDSDMDLGDFMPLIIQIFIAVLDMPICMPKTSLLMVQY